MRVSLLSPQNSVTSYTQCGGSILLYSTSYTTMVYSHACHVFFSFLSEPATFFCKKYQHPQKSRGVVDYTCTVLLYTRYISGYVILLLCIRFCCYSARELHRNIVYSTYCCSYGITVEPSHDRRDDININNNIKI